MKSKVHKQMRNRKRRLERRLRKRQWREHKRRLFADQNIHYDYSEKVRGGRFGGLGVCRLLVQRLAWRTRWTPNYTCSNATSPTTSPTTSST